MQANSNVLNFDLELNEVDLHMLIRCNECGGKAKIGTRNEKHPQIVDLYCSCLDPECGASFVWTLSYSHMLSPSARQAKRLMVDMLKSLPKNEQLELLRSAQQA